jgi:EmrB/QacA subfamily drug resistance transporter
VSTDTTARDSTPSAQQTEFRTAVALAVIVACQLMVVLDNTVINIALAQIRTSLRFSQADLAWVVDAYALAFGGLMLLGGRAGDLVGRRRMLMIGLAVFTAASLVGGLATTPLMLIAARAVQGVGAAMAAPSTLALIAATFQEGPPRNKALSIFSGVSAGAGSLGLILGGVLTTGVSWRWVLFVNVPIGLAIIALAPRFVTEPPRRPARLDLPGAVLSTAGLALVIYGLIQIGQGHRIDGVLTGLFAAGALLLAVFVAVETRSPSPLVPGPVVVHRTRGLLYGVMLCLAAATFGMFFFISQYAQYGLHYTALLTGLAFLPLTTAIFVLSRLMPRVLPRTGPRVPLLVGSAMISISLVWLGQTPASHGYLTGLFGPLLLFGLGSGLCYVPLSATILSGVARDHAGTASGMYQAMQQIGGSLGVAVLVSIAAGNGRGIALGAGALFSLIAFVLTAAS